MVGYTNTKKKWQIWAWLGSFIILSSLWVQVKIDVEIKASFQAGEPKITINNLNQLEPKPDRSLFLFHSTFQYLVLMFLI